MARRKSKKESGDLNETQAAEGDDVTDVAEQNDTGSETGQHQAGDIAVNESNEDTRTEWEERPGHPSDNTVAFENSSEETRNLVPNRRRIFALFGTLPQELQDTVWRHALAPRVITVYNRNRVRPPYISTTYGAFESNYPNIRHLWLAHSNSRSIADQLYPLDRAINQIIEPGRPFRYDPTVDTLSIRDGDAMRALTRNHLRHLEHELHGDSHEENIVFTDATDTDDEYESESAETNPAVLSNPRPLTSRERDFMNNYRPITRLRFQGSTSAFGNHWAMLPLFIGLERVEFIVDPESPEVANRNRRRNSGRNHDIQRTTKQIDDAYEKMRNRGEKVNIPVLVFKTPDEYLEQDKSALGLASAGWYDSSSSSEEDSSDSDGAGDSDGEVTPKSPRVYHTGG